jgi:hypothetical protein
MGPCARSKYVEVCDIWFFTCPSLKRCHVLNKYMRIFIMYVRRTVEFLIPKLGRKRPCMQHATSHLLERFVLPFNNSNMFWSVWNCMLQLDTNLKTNILNISIDILPLVLCTKDLDLLPSLCLY